MLHFGKGQVMSLTNIKKWLKQETGVSRNIPITHLASPDVFETQDGQFGAVLKIKGIPYLTVEADELKQYQQTIHQAILQLDSQFMLMETVHRRYEATTLSKNTFRNDFCQQIHNKYHKQFAKGLYVNDIYLTLIYKGDASRTNKKGALNRILATSNQLMDKTIINARAIARANAIKALNQNINYWLTLFNSFGVVRLGEHEDGFNTLLAYLSLVPNGGKATYLTSANQYPMHANTIEKLKPVQEHYPRGHLGQHLANHRLFFGDAIQFQGNELSDTRFAAMLSIKTYYKTSKYDAFDSLLALECTSDEPGLTNDPISEITPDIAGSETRLHNYVSLPSLNEVFDENSPEGHALDCEFIRTQTFAPMALKDGLDAIKTSHSKKVSAEDDAASQIEELGTLADLVASGTVSIGVHHHSLMVISPSKEGLELAVNSATQAYSKAFIAIVRETLAQPLCFFAQIPGNSRFIARAAPISSENFADFCSLHNTQSGYRDNCLLGEPITLVQTPEKTPVFWNYHKQGSPSNPSSGHSLFIGSNGSGKTALACFLDSQMNRFKEHRSFFLDRNEGAKIYILACNGTYLNLSPTHTHEYRMNPLQLPDTDENRAFCKSWMAALLLEEDEVSIDSHISETINEIVNYGFDHLAPIDRRLSTIASLLSIDFPRWPQLRRWLRASDNRQAGQYDWAFDNEHDALNLNAAKTGIDLTYLMDCVPSHISTPFYMYLLHRIKLSLTGQVTSIIIDEMWQVMKDPYWEKELEHYLPTIRKLFGHIVGMTQSPETIVNSRINHVLLNNNASLVLFTNPKANKEIYIDELKLTSAEFKLIQSHASNSRLVLYKQDHESIFCNLDLSAIRHEMPVLSGNVNSNREVDSLRQQLGTQAKDWLPTFLEQCQ
jgi:type IV secretion system protein VirB4